MDFFHGQNLTKVDLQSLDHVIICTALNNHIYFRHYIVNLKKSGTKLPVVELDEIGPAIDFSIRRFRFATRDLMKQATIQPRQLNARKKKNISTDVFGTWGRVHQGKQDISKLQTRKMKGLKRKASEDAPQAKGPNKRSKRN
eukprot:TRINITY_DN7266_c0_g1_i3.p1 TRINITY_DN7266_c0_g1~~TRINITY_DN7266_c0_g1_i3.p1  ORF type:complete len:142 (-),score=22.29 TRINITY_DN7266_c0_g1_i3:28-453(-)